MDAIPSPARPQESAVFTLPFHRGTARLEPLARVRKASRFLKTVATLGAVLNLGFYVAIAAVPAWFDPLMIDAFPGLTIATAITPIKRVGLLVLMAFPVAVMLYGIWHARQLFVS